MGKYNSWIRSTLSKMGERASKSPVTKVGEKLGAPIRKPIQKHFKLGKDTRNMMREYGLSGSIMGRVNYNKASDTIRGFLKDNTTTGATDYAKSQAEKISKQ